MKRVKIKYIVISLLLIEAVSLFLTCKSYSNKEVKEIKETYKVDKKMFSMYKENVETGKYEEITDSSYFPTGGYRLNLEKSMCVDPNGIEIEGIITGVGNKVTVKSNKTAYCHLYFERSADLYDLCKDSTDLNECFENEEPNIPYVNSLWESPLEGDGIRYVGEDPDNYICFGTEDAETCKNAPDKYMYRIIGIFKDTSGLTHLKLIKKEALDTVYAWHGDSMTDTDWGSSDLHIGLNDTYFINNTDYSYLQDTDWYYLIDDWNYTAVNTLAEESSGPNYYSSISQDVYYHEMNSNNKTNTVGEWTTVTSKIGLMYASDYLLSAGENALTYSTSTHYHAFKMAGWMHLSKNDTEAPLSYEWTISRAGFVGGEEYYAYSVHDDGRLIDEYDSGTMSVRPVFYLKEDATIKSGAGTSENPYVLEPAKSVGKNYENGAEYIEATSSDLWDTKLDGDGIRYVGTNPDNYICFGTTNQNDCMNDTNKYMYRIIGIFEDSAGFKHLKLIKKEALNTAYAWHSALTSNVNWGSSASKTGLNGAYFLTNTEFPYMQDTTWTDNIVTWTYTAVNTLTYSNSGTTYYYMTPKSTYIHEMNLSDKSAAKCYVASAYVTCTSGAWTSPTAQIGLLYLSDYALSLGKDYLDLVPVNDYATLQTGWIHLLNNDDAPPKTDEWSIARYGKDSYTQYWAWGIKELGGIRNIGTVTTKFSMRPVFYLSTDTQIVAGTGTIDNPFIIDPKS